MLFTSSEFILIFVPAVLAGWIWLTSRGRVRGALGWLLAASAIFYGWFKIEYLFLLATLLAANFLCGRLLSRPDRRGRRLILGLGIALDLGVLAYYKYLNFFLGTLGDATGTQFVLHNVALPLGISFFTFQNIAYLVDVHRGRVSSYRALDFALFTAFFPQLVAGPIVHHSEIIPQFRRAAATRPSWDAMVTGGALFGIGLAKKLLIADPMATWVVPAYQATHLGWALGFVEAWAATLAFAVQIYFDFSAYSDMALGLALLFGIRLPQNFDSPYQAASIVDFWRRWHVTLSRFLRDYLYIPLGGSRAGESRRYANLMLTMIIGGLWHGAAFTFVIWGALHGVFLAANHAWRRTRERWLPAHEPTALSALSARALTLLAVVVAWVLFRAESLGSAQLMLAGMAGQNGIVLPPSLEPLLGGLSAWGVRFDEIVFAYWKGKTQTLWVAGALAIALFCPNSQQLLARHRPCLDRIREIDHPVLRMFSRIELGPSLSAAAGAAAAATLVTLLVYRAIQSSDLRPFIYFQF